MDIHDLAEKRKLLEKEHESKDWIEELLGEKFSDPLAIVLHDSKVLCRVINAVKPDSIPDTHYNLDPIPNFKCLENINLFVNECRKIGVKDSCLFYAADLFEQKNLRLVYECILQLKKVSSRNRYSLRARPASSSPNTKYSKSRASQRTKNKGFLNWNINALTKVFGGIRWMASTTGEYVFYPVLNGIIIGIGLKVGHTLYNTASRRLL